MTSKALGSNLRTRAFKLEVEAFLKVCESVNTVRSLTCFLLVNSGEFDQYLDLSFPDTEKKTFPDDYLVTEALRKNPSLPTSYDPIKAAKDNWWKSELQCRLTNSKMDAINRGEEFIPADIDEVLTKTKSIIANILGPLSRECLEYVESHFRFGPGATSSCSGRDVLPSRKFTSTWDVSPRLYPYWRSILSGGPLGSVVENINLRGYSQVTFVPKTAKTHRPIAIEPHMNIYVQLGIGALVRRQLKKFGLDLDVQADANRHLASVAQQFFLSTVDLSSASDTISYSVVRDLFPVEWFALFDLARTEYSVIDGQEVRLSKFSSMGNGFTFELETLLFLAIAIASGDRNAVAFGDDIVLRRDAAPTLIQTLNFLGFNVNDKKTFITGVFFESCGEDYWNGQNVRPFYLKGGYYDYTSAVIRISNKIRRYANRLMLGYGCDVRFLRAWLYLISKDSPARQTGIDLSSGDDGLVRNFDEACPSTARHGAQGFLGRVWRVEALKSNRTSPVGAYLLALKAGSPMISRLRESVRGAGRVKGLDRQLIFRWVDPGPWI